MLITLARKPLGGGNVVNNCLQFGTGAINVDASRIAISGPKGNWTGANKGSAKFSGVSYAQDATSLNTGNTSQQNHRGRWPANVLLVPSPEVLAGFPDTGKGEVPNNGGAARYFKQIKSPNEQ